MTESTNCRCHPRLAAISSRGPWQLQFVFYATAPHCAPPSTSCSTGNHAFIGSTATGVFSLVPPRLACLQQRIGNPPITLLGAAISLPQRLVWPLPVLGMALLTRIPRARRPPGHGAITLPTPRLVWYLSATSATIPDPSSPPLPRRGSPPFVRGSKEP